MLKLRIKKNQTLLALFTFSIRVVNAQLTKESDLFQVLKTKDSLLFTVGFNTCDINQIDKLTAKDFEFYHDKGGVTNTKALFIKAIKENLCGSGKNKELRKLQENSLKVFPLYNQNKLYGALQKGVHSFGTTTARFTHLWLIKNGEWKLSRVMSYDHQQEKRVVGSGENYLKISVSELDFYVGDYRFSPEFVLSMIKENGKLYGSSHGEKVEIKPYAKHQFIAADKSVKINFIIGDDGKITGLTMESPEGKMNAKKIML